MTFSSLAFLFIFFPVIFLLYSIFRNNRVRNILLIIASLLFYAYGEPVAVFIMLISICFNYLFGLMCGGVFGRKVVEAGNKKPTLQIAGLEIVDLEIEDLETEDLETEGLEIENLKAEDLEAEDLEAEDLEAEDLEIENLKAGDLKAGDLEAEDLETEDLEIEDLEIVDLEIEDLEIVYQEEENIEIDKESSAKDKIGAEEEARVEEKKSTKEKTEVVGKEETACKRGAVAKLGLIAAIIMNIGLLIVFKYLDFFMESVGLGSYALHLALPIGISFFTFQGLSYVVDVYRDRKQVQKNILSVMLYISFFPQLIAGPIVKYHDIKEALNSREFNIDRIIKGLQRFIFGLGKKVLIAGPMGLMVDSIFGLNFSNIGVASAWIVGISYMFQIYFDFSGYSDMAIGLGCIFGFDFRENFDKPYIADGIQAFWRRWHISLSTWFKEYVYIPLGGNRKGRARTYINKFIVFMLTGLWHGANWTFICWGMLHGIALIVEDSIKKMFNKEKKVEPEKSKQVKEGIVKHIYTLLFVMVTFIIFRADSISYALKMIVRLFYGYGSNAKTFSLVTPMYLIALVLAIVFSTSLPNKVATKAGKWLPGILSVFVYIISILMLISGGYNPFIYFRF